MSRDVCFKANYRACIWLILRYFKLTVWRKTADFHCFMPKKQLKKINPQTISWTNNLEKILKSHNIEEQVCILVQHLSWSNIIKISQKYHASETINSTLWYTDFKFFRSPQILCSTDQNNVWEEKIFENPGISLFILY